MTVTTLNEKEAMNLKNKERLFEMVLLEEREEGNGILYYNFKSKK